MNSTMSEQFHEWLAECPVTWHRDSGDDTESATYTFNNDKEDG